MKNENREHCKAMALTLEAYAEGRAYRCPDCGQEVTFDSLEEAFETCPDCGGDWEPATLYDWLEGALDIEYRVGRGPSGLEYRSAKIMLAWGGPSIYLDTAAALVTLHWWGENAEFPVHRDACEALDEILEELFEL